MPPSRRKEMTTKRKRRLPPYEQALARRIDYELGEISPVLRQYDWEVLAAWSKVAKCRLAVEAIVSATLDPEWPLFEAAHGWIAAQEDKSLVLACALEEAATTTGRRNQVLEHIVDRYGIEMSASAKAIWTATREGKRFGWDEIYTACGVENWENPPQQSVALNDACRRIMPDPPSEEVLFARALSMIRESTFERLPYVQRQLVLVTLRPGGEKVMEAIQRNFPCFWETVTAVILEPPTWILRVKEGEFVSRLYLLAEALTYELGDMPEGTRQATIDRLLCTSQCPWLWHVVDKLITHTARWEKVPSFLAHKLEPDVIRCLPAVVAAELMKLLVTDDSDHRFDDRWKLVGDTFAERIEASPAPYVAALQPVAQSGKMPLSALTVYMSGVGIELAREGLAGWLQHYHGHGSIRYNEQLRQLLADYVIPNGLTAGKLIRKPEDTEELLKLGYELKPEDVADDQTTKRMLFQEASGYNSNYPLLSLWQNETWREVLLDYASNHEAVLRSALVFAENLESPEGLKWVATHLQPRLESRQELRKHLNEIAWSAGYQQFGGASIARIILAALPEWLDEEDLASAKAYCAAKWYHLKAWLAEVVLTPEEQRQIFFDHAIEDSKTSNFLPFPGNWEHAFPDDPSHQQLASWLLKNEDRIHISCWLAWVVHFGLHPLPQFQRRIRRLLENLSDEQLTTALTLLQSETT